MFFLISGASKICRVGPQSDDEKVETLRRARHRNIINFSDPYENIKVGELISWWLVFFSSFFSALTLMLMFTNFFGGNVCTEDY